MPTRPGQRLAPLMALALLAGCAPTPEAPRRKIMPDLTGRTVCGWDELEGPATLDLAEPGATGALPAGAPIASLRVADHVPFADVARAIAPAVSLVRLKIVYGERWLIAVTIPARTPPPKPKPEDAVVSIVGERKITRHKRAPRERIADLRLDGDTATLYVEQGKPAGDAIAIDALPDRLRRITPPIGVFALSASDATAWRHVHAAISAAACYDRRAGDEPHEVILD
jgi:hypothetical protein